MIAQNVIVQARRQLADEQGPQYRWPDKELIDYLNDGQNEIVRLRPDQLLQADGTIGTVSEPAALGDTLFLSDLWKQGLTDYVCWRAFSTDGADKANAEKAAAHQGNYKARVAS
jgi:hypothetical protein